MFDELREGSRAMIKGVVQLVYFMRGAITYTEMMGLTHGEREMISEFLKQRLELESDKMHPNY
jgi:hypothetical protein